jgi:alkylation response protein AidB-like acyl-CoA dehydrogenase
MHFELDQDRRMLADTLDRFIAEQYPWKTRDEIAQSTHGYSPEMWRRFGELGAIGALFSEADGGYGGTALDIAVVFEALGRGLVVEPFLPAAVLGGGAIAATDGSKHAELLSQIIAGTRTAAFAHEEPDSRYELSRVSTRATASSNAWLLDGDKAVVLHGEHADFFVVSARTHGAVTDEGGISLFLVPAHAQGLTLRGYPLVDGGRAAELTLRRVEVPGDALLGMRGGAFATIEKVVGAGVLALCAEALGAMEVAKAFTLEYLRTRRQFGVPIGTFQALQHRMAEMLLEIEQARSAVINAIAALDADRVKRECALSAAKYTIGRTGTRVAEEAIQMHGGIGMTWELPLAHYAKRLVMIDHQLGDEDHHLQRYIELGRRAATA